MPLTPLDVENLRLRNALRGYDRADVDQFRADVVDSLEEYVDLIGKLKQRVREVEAELARYREQEDVLRSSVMLAQRTADEHAAAARSRAESIVAQAHTEAQALRAGVADLAAQREQFEYQFHGLLTGFLRRLEQGNPSLVGSPNSRATKAHSAVVVHMDTQDLPEVPEQQNRDIEMDMGDLTVQPYAPTTPEPGGGEQVIIPMAAPRLPSAAVPEYARRVDNDNVEFSAALEDAALRPELLAEAQRPISGTPVHEEAEEQGSLDATTTLQELGDEQLREESDTGLPEATDEP